MSEYWDMVKNTMAETKEIVEQNKEQLKARGEVTGIKDTLHNFQLVHAGAGYDDKIEVRADAQTLFGNSFSPLYEACATQDVQAVNSDGVEHTVTVLKAECSYPTEMHSAGLRQVIWSSYDMLPADKKAAYEVALLTKKYAAMDDSEANAQDYANTMASYRQYCDQNDIPWDSVIRTVSDELQTEVSDYKLQAADQTDVYNQISRSAAKSKAQAADAHNLLLSCAPEGYEDTLTEGLDPSVTYEDTCDASYDGSFVAHTAGFLAVVHGAFSAIYEKLPHPIRWAKSVFQNLKNEGKAFSENTQALIEDWDEQSDARIQEQKEVLEQLSGIKEDIKETSAGQAVEEAGDKIKEEVRQSFEDPSQEIQDGRDWLKDKMNQAEPYIDAAGNALKSAGGKVRDYADDFVEKWASPEDAKDGESMDSGDYQP